MRLIQKLKDAWRYGLPNSVYAMEHPRESVFTYICANIEDGKLSDNASIGKFCEPDQHIRYADGAKDGIALSWMGVSQLNDEEMPNLKEALLSISKKRFKSADSIFLELCEKHRAIGLVDQLQYCIMENLDLLDQSRLRKYAIECILCSTKDDLVKVGLVINELYDEPGDELKEIVRTLALSDEFTLFAAWNILSWKNSNEELLEIAKKVHGWGRIGIVKIIEPTTNEIRRWLLFNGVSNHIASFECALECFIKSDAHELLKGNMTYEEFEAVGNILYGLIDGPKKDLSIIDGWQDLIHLYMLAAYNFELSLSDHELILSFYKNAPSLGFINVKEDCEKLLNSDRCKTLVLDAVEDGHALELAEFLAIPYEDELLNAMERDFQELYQCASYVSDDEHISRLVDIYRKHLPLSAIEDDPRDESGLGKDWEIYRRFLFLLQELRHKLPIGLDCILKGLTSPVVNNRTMSLRVLRCWTSDAKRPISELSPESYDALIHARQREPLDSIRADIDQLIGGAYEFDESAM